MQGRLLRFVPVLSQLRPIFNMRALTSEHHKDFSTQENTMNLHLPRSLRAGTGILLLALSLASAAAPVALAAQPSGRVVHSPAAKHTQRLTIHITATGSTVWGTVTVHYAYRGHTVQHSTSQAVSTFTVPRGVTVHLQQQPASASIWPFKQWTIGQGSKASTTGAPALSFKMNHNYQVTALYILQTSSGGNGGYGQMTR
jgi:hypothetical protein